jgi:hypothetical protein
MATRCFKKEGANPPMCGIHNVPLVKATLPIDAISPRLGSVTCYVCPESHSVANEAATQE